MLQKQIKVNIESNDLVKKEVRKYIWIGLKRAEIQRIELLI